MATERDDQLMTPSEAARVLGLSADAVRAMSDRGALPRQRTSGGRRIFRRGDVERVATARKAQKRR